MNNIDINAHGNILIPREDISEFKKLAKLHLFEKFNIKKWKIEEINLTVYLGVRNDLSVTASTESGVIIISGKKYPHKAYNKVIFDLNTKKLKRIENIIQNF